MGLGWGNKVDGHISWDSLSGARLVLGHDAVFWGHCGGFCAPVAQLGNIQAIHADAMRIRTHTYTYIYCWYTYLLTQACAEVTAGKYSTPRNIDRFLHIHTDTCDTYSPQNTYNMHAHTYNTCTYLHSKYLQIRMLTANGSACMLHQIACILSIRCQYLVGMWLYL